MKATPSTSGCPPESAFVDLLEGRLARGEIGRLGRHVEGCDACGALLDALTGGAEAEVFTSHASERAIDDRIARELLLREPVEAPPASAAGRTIDRKYELLRLLGKGGMGEVYEATHTGTGQSVAVKLIHLGLLAHGDEAEGRFRREAKAAAALDSPHIVQVLDAGEDGETGDLYLVMELLRGEDLEHAIGRVGPLLPDVALRIAAQALAGLAEAHAAGIVHRDVKPANVFLARDGEGAVTVKVLDFGVAKLIPDALHLSISTGITRTESVLGSPLYMSPEQMLCSAKVDHRTDLWSLGSALYSALAGRAQLHDVENVFDLLPILRAGTAPALRDRAPWVPFEVADVVARALAFAPEDRYPSAAAMLDAIRPLVPGGVALREEMVAPMSPEARAVVPAAPPAGDPGTAPGPTRPSRAPWIRRPALVAALAIVLLSAGAAALYAAR